MASNKIPSKKFVFSFLIIFSLVILDQLTKVWVIKSGIAHACNMGFAFGIYQGVLNGLVSILVLLVVIYAFFKEQRLLVWFSLALIVGGGLSNIVDRLTRGCVIDFIDLKVWPAFNLADLAITVGVASLIFSIVKEMNNEKT